MLGKRGDTCYATLCYVMLFTSCCLHHVMVFILCSLGNVLYVKLSYVMLCDVNAMLCKCYVNVMLCNVTLNYAMLCSYAMLLHVMICHVTAYHIYKHSNSFKSYTEKSKRKSNCVSKRNKRELSHMKIKEYFRRSGRLNQKVCMTNNEDKKPFGCPHLHPRLFFFSWKALETITSNFFLYHTLLLLRLEHRRQDPCSELF